MKKKVFKYKFYLKLSLLFIFIFIILILFILLFYLDYSIIYFDCDIDSFYKLYDVHNTYKKNYKFLTPIKNIGKNIKNKFKKFMTKIAKLNEKIEE